MSAQEDCAGGLQVVWSKVYRRRRAGRHGVCSVSSRVTTQWEDRSQLRQLLPVHPYIVTMCGSQLLRKFNHPPRNSALGSYRAAICELPFARCLTVRTLIVGKARGHGVKPCKMAKRSPPLLNVSPLCLQQVYCYHCRVAW